MVLHTSNIFDLEVGERQGQGHSLVRIKRVCHKDNACQISMFYHQYIKIYEPDESFCDE